MNPAEHEARADAERRGDVVGSDIDVVEQHILDDIGCGDEADHGCWLWGERTA